MVHSRCRCCQLSKPACTDHNACLLTAMAQWRALGSGLALAVLIWRHLYSSALLVSSSNRSPSAWAFPADTERFRH